jgi:hypothetical protein
MQNEKKEDMILELYNVSLAIAWQFELNQFHDPTDNK